MARLAATLLLAAVLAAAAAAAASAAPDGAVFQEVPLAAAGHLQVLRRATAEETTRFRVLLRQPADGLRRLAEVAAAVSDPDSPMYQQYLGRDDLRELVSPPAEVQRRVVEWLRAHGADAAEARGDFVDARAPAGAVEAMWRTELSWVRGRREAGDHSPPRLVASSGGLTVPAELADAVEGVHGIAETARRRRYGRVVPPSPVDQVVVPETLARQYNFDGLSAAGTTQQVIEFVEDGYSQADMATFCRGVGISPVPRLATRGDVKGQGDGEGVLDVDLIVGAGVGANTTYWALGNGWILDAAQDLNAMQSPPLVNSISWGASEWGEMDHARTDTELQKLAARGVTVLAASGDAGAVGTGQCTGNEHVFDPSFPATSAFVLSVGATQLTRTNSTVSAPACSKFYGGCSGGGLEAPADQPDGSAGDGFATGGGFSVYSPRPSWQDAAVSNYLSQQTDLPPARAFNASNRGYPDVAALGNNMVIYGQGVGGWTTEGGTSASTPVWAGVVALLNAHLARAGRRPLGLVNALLYKMRTEDPATFGAVQPGQNKDGCPHGYVSFESAPGSTNPVVWDPVTGLGTPNVRAMISYLDRNLDMFARA